jgi:hypothetical protein
MQRPESKLFKQKPQAANPLHLWRLIAGSVLAGALTASCGGGGTEPSSPDTAVTLEKANMLPTAQEANDSFVLFDLAMFAGDYMLWGNDWFDNGVAYQCLKDDAASGTVTFTTSSAGSVFQVGDVMTVRYDNCQQDADDPTRTTGSLELQVLAITGDPTSAEIGQPWSYKANVVYKQLTLLSPNERSVVDGEMQVTESSPGVINADLEKRITTRFETASMRLAEDADTHTYSQASGTLLSEYTADNVWTATINTELSSTALAGKLSFVTVEPFKGVLGNSFPSAGLGRIDGGAQQQLLLRAKASGVEGTLTTPQANESFFIDWTNF